MTIGVCARACNHAASLRLRRSCDVDGDVEMRHQMTVGVGVEAIGGLVGNLLSVFPPFNEFSRAYWGSSQQYGVTIFISTSTRNSAAYFRIDSGGNGQRLGDEMRLQVTVIFGSEAQCVV